MARTPLTATVEVLVDRPDGPPPAENVTVLTSADYPTGFTVPAGEVYEFDPDQDVLITSPANVIVNGTLRMRPANAGITHTLRFTGIDESTIVGVPADGIDDDGFHVDIEDTDIGLWVRETGVLDCHGTAKPTWNRTGWDPAWDPTDDVRIAPIAEGNFGTGGFQTFADGDPMPPPYVLPEARDGSVNLNTEVFNLTRNVRIEGEPFDGTHHRAHINVYSPDAAAPHVFNYVELRWLGPQITLGDGSIQGFLGRYPLHFHHSEDGTRGTEVEGTTCHISGNRAFVAHASHGVTFRDCIAYNCVGTPFWYDEFPGTRQIAYERCLAAYIWVTSGHEERFRNSGFLIAKSNENDPIEQPFNRCVDCCAVGVQGSSDSSGFFWPPRTQSTWTFASSLSDTEPGQHVGNVAHNNERHGLFSWQQSPHNHVLEDVVCYRNGGEGHKHGAYTSAYQWRHCIFTDNGSFGQFVIVASGKTSAFTPTNDMDNRDGWFIGEYPIKTAHHRRPSGGKRMLITRANIIPEGGTLAVTIDNKTDATDGIQSGENPDLMTLIDCLVSDDDGATWRDLAPADIEFLTWHPDDDIRIVNDANPSPGLFVPNPDQ